MLLKKEKYMVQFEIEHGMLAIEGICENIFRCVFTKRKSLDSISPLEINICPNTPLNLEETKDHFKISSTKLIVEINKKDGCCLWREKETQKTLLQEKPKEMTETPYNIYTIQQEKPIIKRIKTVDGERNFVENLESIQDHTAYRGKLPFVLTDDEHIYGMGQGEEGIYDYRNTTQYLYQHNMRTPIPFMISSKGYGILMDCGSLMTFNDDCRGTYLYMDMVEQMDYYFIIGKSVDELIAGYRTLTGKAVMLPKWAYGYIQSKEAYHNQQELLDVAAEYRKRNIPLDCVVQDWNTWKVGSWGNKIVDKERYPNIVAMNRELHKMNVHSMISIWPNMNSGTENYIEMESNEYLLNDYATYNAFSENARKLYWNQAKVLFDGGFDSWWCDSTEPFSGPDWNGEFMREPWERFLLVGNEHKKFLNPDRANLFAVAHAKGIFENQRKTAPNKRVLNLTRAGYASIQKYGTVLWSGDISATWETFRRQIVEGLNTGLSGIPYWTLDIGGFFTVNEKWQNRGCSCNNDPTPKWFWRGDYEEGVNDYGYRELYVRWLQYGAFLPVFRSHGTDTPREVWNFGNPGEMFYDAIVETIHMRYRLIPYIYSMARKVWKEDYTILRSLLFDFSADEKTAVISSEFMFGDNLLICPITEPMYYEKNSKPIDKEKVWMCYLPLETNWYDFYTGKLYQGGQNIQVKSSINQIPVFVKEGSIIPMEQELQYAQEKVDTPLELHIYPGKNAIFYLYEDSGEGYSYEHEEYQIIPVVWDDDKKELTIGDMEGIYYQGIVGRSCRVVLNGTSKEVMYQGAKISLSFN